MPGSKIGSSIRKKRHSTNTKNSVKIKECRSKPRRVDNFGDTGGRNCSDRDGLHIP